MQHRVRNGRPIVEITRRTILIACLVAAAGLLALLLRLRQAQAPMVFDEYASLYFADQSFGDLWGWWLQRETNPPLFYSVLKLWRLVAPESQAALRLLPLLISAAQIALVGRLVGKTYGWMAGLACLLLFALSPSDIYQSEYVRGYGLAKLAVTVSFIGLIAALRDSGRNAGGWAAYVAGAAVAIYSHTTMLLWPAIASIAVLVEAAAMREIGRRHLLRLALADLAITGLAVWALLITYFQMRTSAANISWIEPLSADEFATTANLQLLLAGSLDSLLMGALMIVGILRTIGDRVTRLSLLIVIATVALFQAGDLLHPITTDFTLHWCATFTTLLAAAAFAPLRKAAPALKRAAGLAAGVALAALAVVGLKELEEDGAIPRPQDWRYVIETVARTPGAALLVSHESIGVVVEQACKLRFHRPACPFPLVVMENPAPSDSWAFGGYDGAMTPVSHVREILRPARTVFVFSRYVYTPLTQLGIDRTTYRTVEWDDGELIGPIAATDFHQAGARGPRSPS